MNGVKSSDRAWYAPDGRVGLMPIRGIKFVELPKVGQYVQALQPCGTGETSKATFSIYSPVSGKVAEVNHKAISDPSKISTDPYGTWLFKVAATSGTGHLKACKPYQIKITGSTSSHPKRFLRRPL